MRSVQNMLNAVLKINIHSIAVEALEENADELLRRNKEQLFDGKMRDGSNLSPTYLEDPYFKSTASAQRYSDWKDKITPSSKREKGVPNLYIIGTYYESKSIAFSGDNIIYSATFKGAEIEQKYGEGVDGLGGKYKSEFIQQALKPSFMEKIEKELNKK